MNLDSVDLASFLEEKGVDFLFHANTLRTSLSFIEAGGLLSRGDVERLNLQQTPQRSDPVDKKFDVWNDIFLDTIDLHGYFPRENIYGPITFKFRSSLIRDAGLNFQVLKSNPERWVPGEPEANRRFGFVNELRNGWGNYERQQMMLTIRQPGSAILFQHMEEIIVDSFEEIVDGHRFSSQTAIDAIRDALSKFTTSTVAIRRRDCVKCYCQQNYREKTTAQLALAFSP